MAGQQRQLLDTRSDAKLETFNGERQKFEQWAFLFESYTHLLGWGLYVDNAMRHEGPITHASLGPEAQGVNGDLYYTCWRAR